MKTQELLMLAGVGVLACVGWQVFNGKSKSGAVAARPGAAPSRMTSEQIFSNIWLDPSGMYRAGNGDIYV